MVVKMQFCLIMGCLIGVMASFSVHAQQDTTARFVFYNVENLIRCLWMIR